MTLWVFFCFFLPLGNYKHTSLWFSNINMSKIGPWRLGWEERVGWWETSVSWPPTYPTLPDTTGPKKLFCFGFCHNLIFFRYVTIWFFLVLSWFEFLSFVTIWVLEFSHNLGFVIVLVFEFSSNLVFLSLLTVWVFDFFTIGAFEFCPNLSFGVVTNWVFKFCQKLSF